MQLVNMSSNKMELSLDEILKTNKNTRGQGRGGRRSNPARAAASAAPIGGVAKSTRQSKQAKTTSSAPAATSGGETKIMVSNLVRTCEETCPVELTNALQPLDVEQAQLQVCKTVAGL